MPSGPSTNRNDTMGRPLHAGMADAHPGRFMHRLIGGARTMARPVPPVPAPRARPMPAVMTAMANFNRDTAIACLHDKIARRRRRCRKRPKSDRRYHGDTSNFAPHGTISRFWLHFAEPMTGLCTSAPEPDGNPAFSLR